MKTKWTIFATITLLSTFNLQLATLHAQGSLTPPGAPAPTMKSLDQIEPRIAITNLPLTISQPGSYYFTANLDYTNGTAIHVTTNNVTIDLNGFTLSGNPVFSGINT